MALLSMRQKRTRHALEYGCVRPAHPVTWGASHPPCPQRRVRLLDGAGFALRLDAPSPTRDL